MRRSNHGISAWQTTCPMKYERCEMLHPHLPRWASHVIDDVEREGELQLIGFVLVVTMLIGTLLFGVVTAIAELTKTLR